MMVESRQFGFRSHRLSFFLKNKFLPDDIFVCHKCDVPLCVNPDHLFLGGQQINQADKVMKDRQAFGEKHGRSKLTVEQVKEIRRLHICEGVMGSEIARKFGMARSSIQSILDGTNWSRVPFPDPLDDY